MIHAAGKNWNDLPTSQKRGRCIVRETYNDGAGDRSRWVVDAETPIFTDAREYIERHLAVKPEDEEPILRFGDYDSTKDNDESVRVEILNYLEAGMNTRELLQALVENGTLAVGSRLA
jgi:hypothetical protein